MAPAAAKEVDMTPPTTDPSSPPNKVKKKKKKKTTTSTPSAAQEAAYAPHVPSSGGGGATQKISVKPGRQSVQLDGPSTGTHPPTTSTATPVLPTQATPAPRLASTRKLVEPPEGGYASGFYRVLLETKRVETLCRSLTLQYHHVAQLHKLFRHEDDYSSGEITIEEFFAIINDEKRPLTVGMFAYVGLDAKIKKLTFDQFVLCIVTFAALSRKELLHFAFTLFDKDDSGIMDMNELRAFCGNLKNKNGFFFQKNVEIAQQKLADRDHTSPGAHRHAAGANGLVDFDDLQDGSEHFQVAFFPLMQFQRNIQMASLGETFWANVSFKKSQIERVVHYMRLHKGHLPPLSIAVRLSAMAKHVAFLLTGGGVCHGGAYALRNAAITKYAAELRQHELEVAAATQAKEENTRKLLAQYEAAKQAEDPVGEQTTVQQVAQDGRDGIGDEMPPSDPKKMMKKKSKSSKKQPHKKDPSKKVFVDD